MEKIFDEIYEIIEDRKENPVEDSYTNYLLDESVEKITKKVGEEATEVVIAAMKDNNDELAEEISDLFYHILVLMVDRGLSLDEVQKVLRKRRG